MRKEDHEHIAQCCHSLNGLVKRNDGSQREFDEDEEDRFIDRLVWAIGASPGGRMEDDQKEELTKKIVDVIRSCARVADPTEIIAGRMLELFVIEIAALEDQPLDHGRFVKRCKGEMG